MDTIKLVEVSPRDGLQNEKKFVPTPIKIEFINRLINSGVKYIEATSFVSPKKIPQLADNQQVIAGITPLTELTLSALVPNSHGLTSAIQSKLKEVAVFGAASETFCQHNINCSMTESLSRFSDVILLAQKNNIKIRGYISCAFACPYEGIINPTIVVNYAKKLYQLGCYEICYGDTIGVATPAQVKALLSQSSKFIPIEKTAMHFHDTYGQAIANIYASTEQGIRTFDASVAGLGGCPYAPGASGNVATEDVLYLLSGLGFDTGIDLKKLIRAGEFINQFLVRETQSKVAKVL